MKPKVGAQLYTCREYLKTFDDAKETLKKVANIGYKYIQLSGLGPIDYRELAKVIDDLGLQVVSTHTGWDRFLTDLDSVIEEHLTYKCNHPAIGGVPSEYRNDEGLRRFIDQVTVVSMKLVKAGMDFSYHNHNWEFAKIGEKTWLELLYQYTSPAILKAELDTYWVQAGGADPAYWIEKLTGRQVMLHLKDMRVTLKGEQRFAEVGEGNLNWPRILKAAEDAGVEFLLVEQDLCYDRDPFTSFEISYRNLRNMGYF